MSDPTTPPVMSPVVRARIWYGDGSVVDVTNAAEWQAARNTNVQVVAWVHEAGGVTWQWGSEDVYTFPGSSQIKRGRWMKDAEFAALLAQAKAAMGA